MEVFINKMRRLPGIRKLILIEETGKPLQKREWQSISNIYSKRFVNTLVKQL